ncbi:PAS domain-containing sensor histidine kinase [Hymenobacter persicinus]|uniref:histidine kinase n=1 Tax=Hymenobacter persicinus TaxID=2025506 RepID=A0A4Q5LEL1_9BACT|nr:PAS domain-containing sensor histidine kinase [Hymenobacter persicinus]RYU82488.1 PAS domain-containing sensor histidine kinase [Hymenobacter persicinus]
MTTPESTSGNALFEHRSEAGFEVDATGQFRRVSPGLAALLRQSAEQVTDTTWWEHLAAADREPARRHLEQALAGQPATFEAGRLSWQLLPQLTADGRIGGAYGFARVAEPSASVTQALMERERHLSVIFDSIADVTFVLNVEGDGRYRFLFANKAFQATTGLPMEQVVGSYVQDIIPEPSLSLVLTKYGQAITTGQRVVWEEVSHYPTGEVTGQVSVTPVFDEAGHCGQLVGIVHDLTELKKGEEELRVSNERFQYALKATTDALYDWNVAHDTLYWGEGFESLFGHALKHNPAPFSHWSESVHPADYVRTVQGLRRVAYETTQTFWQEEYRFHRADGSWAHVFDRGYILRDEQGRPVRMIGAMQDITARKKLEEKQHLLAERLLKQNSDLQQCAYIISHNLRAPLANALGFTDLLNRIDKDSQVFTDSLKNLHSSLLRLDAVLTDVNTILAIHDQQDVDDAEQVAVAAVWEQVVEHCAPELRAAGAEVVSHVPAALRIVGNRAFFHSIFDNLLANSLKYRAAERPLRVEVEASTEDSGTIIRFRDNGSGFDQARAGDDVFQLYRRFHADRPGRGMGLFLVKAHTEAMNGQVSVRSEVNQGTEFILYFRRHGHENLPD